MNKLTTTIAALAATAIATTGLAGATASNAFAKSNNSAPRTFELTILQTNDLHGHLEEILTLAGGRVHENNVAKYATLIDQVRATEENVLVVDGGDVFLRGEFEAYQGALETQILKRIKYDAMVLGNNDFRVPPAGTGTAADTYEQLKDYQRTVNFPILLGNVVDEQTGKYLPYTQPYKVFSYKGIKVGLIGVTSMKPEQRGWADVAGMDFIEPTQALPGLIAEVSPKSDVNVILSHAGNPEDHNIAKLAGIDAVIGADTHKVIRTPETQVNAEGNIVPITQAGGEQEHYLGRLDLTFSFVNGEYVLTSHSGFLYDLDGVRPDQRILDLIASYR